MRLRLFIALLLCLPMQAMEVASLKKDTDAKADNAVLPKDKAWLVHITRAFPQDGCIIAGTFPRLGFQVSVIDGEESTVEENDLFAFTLEETYQQAREVITAIRNSVHWSANSLVYPHRVRSCESYFDRTESSYVILEPLAAFDDKQLHGFWQDIFHLGPHRLSSQALILVPASDTDYKKYVGSFKGTIVPYEGDVRTAVEEILKDQEVPVLYPCMEGIEDPGIKHVLTGRKQKVLIDDQLVSSEAIASCLDVENCLHEGTEIEKLQKLMEGLLKPIRSAQAMRFLWKQIFSGADIQDMLVCAQCKNPPSQKQLSACSSCKVVCYCSLECQNKHWTSHKAFCKKIKAKRRDEIMARILFAYQTLLLQMLKGLQQTYCKYLRGLEFLRTFTTLINTEFDPIMKEAQAKYSSQKEQDLLSGYEAYCKKLLAYCYSPGEFAYVRNGCDITKLRGFLAFAELVAQQISEDEALIDGHSHGKSINK